MIHPINLEQIVQERYAAGARQAESALCCRSSMIRVISPSCRKRLSKKTTAAGIRRSISG